MIGQLRNILKGYFEAGDRPNDTQFTTLLDSVIIQNDSNGAGTDKTTLLGGIIIQGDSFFNNSNTVSMNGNLMVGALHGEGGNQTAPYPFQVYGSQDESIILSSGSISDVSFEGVSSNSTSSIKLRDNYEDGGVHFGTHTGKAFIKVNDQELFHITGSTTGGGFETYIEGNLEVMGGDVGIGTLTPDKKVHVYNGEVLIEPVTYAANQNKYVIKAGAYNNTGFDGWGLKLKSDGSTNSYLSFVDSVGSGNTDRVVIRDGGKVGIGTNAPDSLLHVLAEGDNLGAVDLLHLSIASTTTEGSGSLRFSDGTDPDTQDFRITFHEGNNDLKFHSDETDNILYLDKGGNVGVGTNSPSYKLDVAGQFRAIGDVHLGDGDGDDVNVAGTIKFPLVADTGGSFPIRHTALRFPGTDDRALIDYGFTADDAYEIRLVLQDSNADRFKIISDSASDFTALDINGDSARFFQDNGANDGFVTIGDTTADRRLRIKSRAVNSDVLVIEGASSGHDIIQLSELTSGAGRIDILDGSGNNDVRISANSTNHSYINSGANFGIGTTSPNTKLHIKDSSADVFARLETDKTDGRAELVLENDAKQWNVGLGQSDQFLLYDATNTRTTVFIDKDSATNTIYTNATGVGIGGIPTEKLEIHSGHIKLNANYGIGVQVGSYDSSASTYAVYPYMTGVETSMANITPLTTPSGNGLTIASDDFVYFTESDGNTLRGSMSLNSNTFDWSGDMQANRLYLNNGLRFADSSAYWLATGASYNWGLYWNTTDNKIEFKGAGTTRGWIDLDTGETNWSGNMTCAGGLTVGGTTSFEQGFRTYAFTNSGSTNTGWYKAFTFPYSTYSHQEFKIVHISGGNSSNNDKLADILFHYKNQNGVHQFTSNVINMGKIPFGAGKLTHPGTSEDGKAHIAVHRDGTATSGTIHVYMKNTSTHDLPTWTILGTVFTLTWDGSFVGTNDSHKNTAVGGFSNDTWSEYRINAGITSLAGDLGIKTGFGTTSPAYPIDVLTEESQAAYINIKTTNDDGGGSGADHVGFRMMNNNQTSLLYTSPTGDFKLKLHEGGDTYPFTIKTGAPNNSLVVTDDGRINIGTSSGPTAQLYISGRSADWNETLQGLSPGTIHLDPGSSSNNFGNAITWGASDSSSGTTAQAGIYVRSDGGYGTKMYFSTTSAYASGPKTAMFIDHNGNVGIGKTNPDKTLDVDGHIATNGNNLYMGDNGQIYWSDNTDAAVIFFESTGDAAGQSRLILETRDNGDEPIIFRQKHSSTIHERMRIHTNGYVGIGHNTPSYPLEVQATSVGGIYVRDLPDEDIIAWSGGGVRAMTTQGGVSIGCDSSLFLHAGDHRGIYESGPFNIGDATTAETLWLTSDGAAAIVTNMQNGIEAEYKKTTFSTAGDIILHAGGKFMRSDHYSGHLEGSYNNIGDNSSKTNPIYTIGANYNPGETTLSNMYGIGFSHNNNSSYLSTQGGVNSWGLYVAGDGDARAFIAGSNDGRSYLPGNLGIDTVTAGQKLTINGTAAESWNGGLGFQRDGNLIGRIIGDTAGIKFRTHVASDGFFFRNSSNHTSMFISHDSFVSIGGNDDGTNLNYPMGFDGTADMGAYVEIQNERGGDAKASVLAVMSAAQGDGVVYVGQSTAHGGGIAYRGDATNPGELSNLYADKVNLFRTTSSVNHPVICWAHDNNRVGINCSPGSSRILAVKQISEDMGIHLQNHNDTNYWGIDFIDSQTGFTAHSLAFRYNGGNGGGYLKHTFDADQISFTGQHYNRPSVGPIGNYAQKIGYIVIADGTYDNFPESENRDSANVNESLPKVALSSQSTDKRVFGVISNTEDYDSSTRHHSIGVWATSIEKERFDDRLIINSIGEGGIWVSNYNGNLENGDYITTSPIEGIGMKQDDDLLHNYTVAKITQDCDFASETTDVTYEGETYKMVFVGCTYHCG